MSDDDLNPLHLGKDVAEAFDQLATLRDQMKQLHELLDDRLIQVPKDLRRLPIFVVIEQSPAHDALVRIAQRTPRPGSIHPLKRAEFMSFRDDVLAFSLFSIEDTVQVDESDLTNMPAAPEQTD